MTFKGRLWVSHDVTENKESRDGCHGSLAIGIPFHLSFAKLVVQPPLKNIRQIGNLPQNRGRNHKDVGPTTTKYRHNSNARNFYQQLRLRTITHLGQRLARPGMGSHWSTESMAGGIYLYIYIHPRSLSIANQ